MFSATFCPLIESESKKPTSMKMVVIRQLAVIRVKEVQARTINTITLRFLKMFRA